jgi:hypothetical protein
LIKKLNIVQVIVSKNVYYVMISVKQNILADLAAEAADEAV